MANILKIFLLTPDSNLREKIVWADSCEDARSIADGFVRKRKEQGYEIEIINGVYSKPTTSCKEITSLVESLRQFSEGVIHFRYLGIEIHLGKNMAEFLSKFQNDEC